MNTEALDELRARGYVADVYEPADAPAVIAVRGFGVAVTFGEDDLEAHLAALLDPATHAERVRQHLDEPTSA